MDDGGIVGRPELLLKVWEILKKGGVPLGLELNSKKCEWSWLNPDCNLVCPIDGVPITPTSEIQIGVPLGSQEFTESFVKRDLLDVAEGVMSKLIDFEDTQAAIFLLRLSFGIVRATHFIDEKVSKLSQCLGLKPTDEAYPKAGGLGVRRTLDHANGAFTASWHEAQVITEKWTKPPDKDCSG